MLESTAQQDLAFAASLEVSNNTMYIEDYQLERTKRRRRSKLFIDIY
jgi:hypothetical protein